MTYSGNNEDLQWVRPDRTLVVKTYAIIDSTCPLVKFIMEQHPFYGQMHYEWPFLIAMLNYQRVDTVGKTVKKNQLMGLSL